MRPALPAIDLQRRFLEQGRPERTDDGNSIGPGRLPTAVRKPAPALRRLSVSGQAEGHPTGCQEMRPGGLVTFLRMRGAPVGRRIIR